MMVLHLVQIEAGEGFPSSRLGVCVWESWAVLVSPRHERSRAVWHSFCTLVAFSHSAALGVTSAPVDLRAEVEKLLKMIVWHAWEGPILQDLLGPPGHQ